MAEQNPPVWMQSGTYSAAEDRMVTGLLSSRSVDGTTGQTKITVDGGVVGGFDQMRVTANGTNLAIQVSAGAVIVPAGSSPPGAYLCYNNGSIIVTLDAEMSGNPRSDLVVAEVIDSAIDPDATSLWRIKVVKGNPSPSAQPPDPTGYQFPIAYMTVKPASLNGGVNKVSQTDVTDVRVFNTAQGGVAIKWTNLPYPPVSPGRLVYNVNAKKLQISHGVPGDWQDVYTQSDWKSVLSAMGPLQASRSAGVTKNSVDNWDPTPNVTGTSNAIEAIQRFPVRAPNKKLKINISAIGRVGETTSSGHVGVKIFQGSTVVWDANYLHAPSFYSKTWNHSSVAFLAYGLPDNTDLTVRLVFARRGENGGSADFRNIVMVVEPTF